MQANVTRPRTRLAPFEVALCPHLKTAKSVEIARRLLTGGTGPAPVSTLREAEAFAEARVKDILYAVRIAPQKLPRVLALRTGGCDLAVILGPGLLQAARRPRHSTRAGHPALPEADFV